MKLIELIQIKNVFKPDMKFKDIQTGYKVMKLLKQIENDCAFYDQKLMEIAQECAEKDGDKIKTTEDGNLYLSKEKVDEWNKRTADLANIEIEVNLPSFAVDDFEGCDFNLSDLVIIEPLISE